MSAFPKTLHATVRKNEARSGTRSDEEIGNPYNHMNNSIFYIIGVIVVVVAILKFVGVW